MRRVLFIALAVVVLAAAPARAQEVVELDPLTFMIEAPKRIGQRVRVQGVVYQANFSSTLFKLPGGSATLKAPWRDREDFRALLPRCEGFSFDVPDCRMIVEGTLDGILTGEIPILVDVDFLFD